MPTPFNKRQSECWASQKKSLVMVEFQGNDFSTSFSDFRISPTKPSSVLLGSLHLFWGESAMDLSTHQFSGDISWFSWGGVDLFFVATKPTYRNGFVVFVSWLVQIDPARWAEFLKTPHLLLKTSLTPQSKRSMYLISSSNTSTDFMSTNSSLLIWVGGLGF